MVAAVSLKISFWNGDITMSLARKHFNTVVAAKAATISGDDGTRLKEASVYELMLIQLNEDKRKLSSIQSIEHRAGIKRELLPKYEPYVDGVLQGGKGAQDDVLMTVMLWRIDALDFDGALVIGRYAIAHGLAMPDKFERTTATLLSEEIAINALTLLGNAETDKAALLESLVEVEQLTRDQDMPDQVRARLHKALGYCLTDIDPAQALVELKRAYELHDKSGVKTDISRLEKLIKKMTDPENNISPSNQPTKITDSSNSMADVIKLGDEALEELDKSSP
ncbi:small terminase subunit [Agitococcus lubricus]|uniref:Small terminase subunit n=2 Tax=Agitococcus lubricus TaxID=1077255 RepID=A0A2T5J1H0_9GAMM|nr:small terminase subunit [Agitococcus lubricus]